MEPMKAEIVLRMGDTDTVLGDMVALTSISMGVPGALESIIERAVEPKDKNYSLILIEREVA